MATVNIPHRYTWKQRSLYIMFLVFVRAYIHVLSKTIVALVCFIIYTRRSLLNLNHRNYSTWKGRNHRHLKCNQCGKQDFDFWILLYTSVHIWNPMHKPLSTCSPSNQLSFISISLTLSFPPSDLYTTCVYSQKDYPRLVSRACAWNDQLNYCTLYARTRMW